MKKEVSPPTPPPLPPISLQKFAEEDIMMKEFYHCYFVEKYMPDKQEIYATARFFATFAIGCNRVGVEGDTGLKMGYRLNCYIWMLKKLGYKSGKFFVRRKVPGIEEMLSRMFYAIGVD